MKVKISKFKKNGKRDEKVEISSDDTYSLYSTLARVIYPALVRFKNEKEKMGGVPMAFFDGFGSVDEHGNPTGTATEAATKKYNETLDKMIWSFREIAEDNPGESQFFLKNGKKWKTKKEKRTEDYHTYKIVETGLDFDKKGYDEYHDRVQEGVDLFGKYFQSLWW